MGSQNIARCTNCRFTKVFTFGGGMDTYRERSLWIAYCEPCDEIEQINVVVNPTTASNVILKT